MALYVASNLFIRGEKKHIKNFLSQLPKKPEEIKSKFFQTLTGSNKYKEANFLLDNLVIEKDSIYLMTSSMGYNPIELIKIISSRQPELVFEHVVFLMEIPSAYCEIIKFGDIVGESEFNSSSMIDFYEPDPDDEDDENGCGEWDYDGVMKALIEKAHKEVE